MADTTDLIPDDRTPTQKYWDDKVALYKSLYNTDDNGLRSDGNPGCLWPLALLVTTIKILIN